MNETYFVWDSGLEAYRELPDVATYNLLNSWGFVTTIVSGTTPNMPFVRSYV